MRDPTADRERRASNHHRDSGFFGQGGDECPAGAKVMSRPLQYRDDYNLVYASMVLAGVGFLLPYNSFVNAVDFYQQRFQGHLIVFDISMTYIAVMLISVLMTNFMVTRVHLRWRITFGYLVALVVLFVMTIFDIILNVFPTRWSYGLTLFSAAIISLGCTVQQSSFYGYASLLPSRYTQAVMLGESCAGFIVSLNRLLTKRAVASLTPSTALFFIASSCLLLLCLVVFTLGVKSRFVRQFIPPTAAPGAAPPPPLPGTAAAGVGGGTDVRLDADDRARMLLSADNGGGGGVENPAFQAEMLDLAQPTPTSPASSAASASLRENAADPHPLEAALSSLECQSPLTRLKAGLHLRLGVAHSIWRYMLSIGLCYLVTVSLFPGIESEIPSCCLRDWAPVLLMALFNGSDLIGKALAALRVPWKASFLLMFAIIRFCLVPFLMAAASPRQKPHIRGEGWVCFLTVVLGLSNGYFGSVPMILAPKTVHVRHREIAGNLMTLSYSIGLTAGSGLAYWLDDLLGPIPAKLNTWQFACGLYNISEVLGRR